MTGRAATFAVCWTLASALARIERHSDVRNNLMIHYHTDSMAYVSPEPRHKLCMQYDAVTLQQRGKDNFAVCYGMEVHAGLTYVEACDYLGRALMHQGACDGLLDNRLKGERY
jgi:hypothetical protein